MTGTSKNFILAGIVMITITTLLVRCKSGEETKVVETTADADTTLVEETIDTSVMTGTKTIVVRKPLTVVIENLESATAPVYVSIYGTQSKFPSPKGQLKEYKFTPHGKQLIAEIADIKFGTYALATYQDVNSSGEIDKNFIGIPTEGYAFSKNYKPTIKAPNFKDCCFAYNAKSNSVTMKMIQ